MTTRDEDFIRRLRATFKVEAAEHVQAMATAVLELEKTPALEAQRDLVETVFRAAHSLKGAARAVDFTDIESRCQSLEDMFAAWKRHCQRCGLKSVWGVVQPSKRRKKAAGVADGLNVRIT